MILKDEIREASDSMDRDSWCTLIGQMKNIYRMIKGSRFKFWSEESSEDVFNEMIFQHQPLGKKKSVIAAKVLALFCSRMEEAMHQGKFELYPENKEEFACRLMRLRTDKDAPREMNYYDSMALAFVRRAEELADDVLSLIVPDLIAVVGVGRDELMEDAGARAMLGLKCLMENESNAQRMKKYEVEKLLPSALQNAKGAFVGAGLELVGVLLKNKMVGVGGAMGQLEEMFEKGEFFEKKVFKRKKKKVRRVKKWMLEEEEEEKEEGHALKRSDVRDRIVGKLVEMAEGFLHTRPGNGQADRAGSKEDELSFIRFMEETKVSEHFARILFSNQLKMETKCDVAHFLARCVLRCPLEQLGVTKALHVRCEGDASCSMSPASGALGCCPFFEILLVLLAELLDRNDIADFVAAAPLELIGNICFLELMKKQTEKDAGKKKRLAIVEMVKRAEEEGMADGALSLVHSKCREDRMKALTLHRLLGCF
ncbi:uncharacterized protein MONOS_13111 [Monocercomonoides exilis]|uniref:uncharacterized protein n=1 Tax=Monocercomonoides exilis TaxID=2049356 RepID=UPI00355A3E6E|nr:hypothetical protein MONOS_13111 [Monocercomonoides exilis]|eukprot:MONOS_13111.1-p1 / transcript=MONOS_13111.1 / gene=MONOS_13111 / organism=Monocercomonoides_exilis_PA203 / gene_product=unspecified product / transcript_product=unspecified product / location=Mono_scaffold00779:14459-16060(+) / protein_length=483 / sequence_SO=supercontig / SO=protein_coding / is_pseudo=false